MKKTVNVSERVNCKNMSSQNFIMQSVTGYCLLKFHVTNGSHLILNR